MLDNIDNGNLSYDLPEMTQEYIDAQMLQFEAGFVTETAETSEASRANYLYDLPAFGFTPERREDLIGQIAAVGFPVENFRNFVHRSNDGEDEGVLASWGIGQANKGEFSVHELHYTMAREKQLGTLAHESAHANTPLLPENAHLFGGEAERSDAERYVQQLARQSLDTGKWLNGYHKYLAGQYNSGEIGYVTFVEETSAIASELALTNRNHLRQVEAAQHKSIDNIARIARISGRPEPLKVAILTSDGNNAEAAGIDRNLVRLLDGVHDRQSLLSHIDGLKARFYPEQSLVVAANRGSAIIPVDLMRMLIDEQNERLAAHKNDDEVDATGKPRKKAEKYSTS